MKNAIIMEECQACSWRKTAEVGKMTIFFTFIKFKYCCLLKICQTPEMAIFIAMYIWLSGRKRREWVWLWVYILLFFFCGLFF